MSQTSSSEDQQSSFSSRFELICGLTLAVFAATLAVNDLGAGKFGDDELIAHGQAQQAYAWYASKGLKENLAEGQLSLLRSLIASGTIPESNSAGVKQNIADLESLIARYQKEKKEILLGSSTVGEANWVQDIDGELGRVTGAKEYDALANHLGGAGDRFDLGTLFLQLCLVIGAISLILKSEAQKKFFFAACILLGGIGTIYTILSYLHAWRAPLA